MIKKLTQNSNVYTSGPQDRQKNFDTEQSVETKIDRKKALGPKRTYTNLMNSIRLKKNINHSSLCVLHICVYFGLLFFSKSFCLSLIHECVY